MAAKKKNAKETGELSIETENLFPIIKKWLYSEKDIFLRELVANSLDAITKLQKIISFGDYSGSIEPLIRIKADTDKGTLTVSDNGLGMTREEIGKYINQIAFSGIEDFVKKYQEKDEKDQIIGFFGVGFYSTFMVSSKVEIISRSYQKGATAVKWSCEGTTKYSLEPAEREEVGTDVILYLDDENKDYLKKYEIKKIISTHCQFLPVPIEFEDEKINEPDPLWNKSPSEVTDDDYKKFYRDLYGTFEEPLFWIHLNVDYPFELKGILYFPKLKREMEAPGQQIRIYCNQMFVTDHSKELVPDFLTLLQGAVDSPDIPLNISRSMLQRNPTVMKIGRLIVREIAGKINSMYKDERERLETIWPDVNSILKYGTLQDKNFYGKIKDSFIYLSSAGGYITLTEYLERNKEKNENTVLYATDRVKQATYLGLVEENGLEALIMDSLLDVHFIQFLESENSELHFLRVDSDISRFLKKDDENEEAKEGEKGTKDEEKIEEIFKKYLGKEEMMVKAEMLTSEKVPAMLVVEEQMRRYEDMSKLFKTGTIPFHTGHALVVNLNNPIIKNILKLYRGRKKDREEKMKRLCGNVYDLALLSQGKLKGDELTAFIKRSEDVLESYGS
jgi:molecular chaperone HtpG